WACGWRGASVAGRPRLTGSRPAHRHQFASCFRPAETRPTMTPPFQPPAPGGTQPPPPVIRVHRNDLPDLDAYPPGRAVAIDTETLGLERYRDRLCVVQLSPGDGSVDIVQVDRPAPQAPNLRRLLEDPARLKILHYARFDMGVLNHAYGV